jgi:hypothetical protein
LEEVPEQFEGQKAVVVDKLNDGIISLFEGNFRWGGFVPDIA